MLALTALPIQTCMTQLDTAAVNEVAHPGRESILLRTGSGVSARAGFVTY